MVLVDYIDMELLTIKTLGTVATKIIYTAHCVRFLSNHLSWGGGGGGGSICISAVPENFSSYDICFFQVNSFCLHEISDRIFSKINIHVP